MGLRVGDRVEVSYPVDDFPGHVGIVREIIEESTEFPGKTYEMNDKSILNILEQIANACKILSQEVYSSLDYSNSTIDICANKFQELEFKIWELQKVYKNGDEKIMD